ncbi:MAG: hypothetical protein ACI82O_004288 [Patiriisocius sp.]|jgi:hypothetical protein
MRSTSAGWSSLRAMRVAAIHKLQCEALLGDDVLEPKAVAVIGPVRATGGYNKSSRRCRLDKLPREPERRADDERRTAHDAHERPARTHALEPRWQRVQKPN